MKRQMNSGALVLALGGALLFAACGGGGGSGGTGDTGSASPLVLIDASVSGTDGVPINEIIRFEFSVDLDPDTVRPDTIRVRQGPDYGKQVPGTYRVDGNRVEFFPRLPVLADLSDSGFQPGTPYRITLPGSPDVATVRSFANDHITETVTLDFQTADASSAGLFRNNFLDQPYPKILFVNPPDGASEVPADGDITLTFNRRPLHPGTVTDTNIRLWLEERGGETLNRVIPINLVLEQSYESVQVRVVPKFPLADVATYRLEVNRRLQDLTGNDVDLDDQSLFVSRFTVRDEPFRNTSISLTFSEQERAGLMDENESTASWNEVVPDAVAAIFTAAGGNGTAGDLKPNASQTLDPDDFKRGVETMVIDGVETDVYNFRTIEIPAGVQVRFQQRPSGPNRPIVLLSLKNVQIAGTLNVSGGKGGDGEGTNYSTSAIPLARGGEAGPGGGDGSDNDTSAKFGKSLPIMDGDDVFYGGGGGEGGGAGSYSYSYSSGSYGYRYYYSIASGGGGGGGNRTRGSNGQDGRYPSSGYYGLGGAGGQTAFDRGFGYNFERRPNVGGGGGAAGAKGFYDYYYSSGGYTSRSQYYGGAGAGGGGGGGISVQSAGDVTVASTGAIVADGGDGGLAMKYYYYSGGGGGAGAGGSVKIAATGQVYFDAGATISVAGGTGGPYTGTYTYYGPGPGGDGGQGYIRIEAIEDENAPGKALVNGVAGANMTYGPPSIGTFAPEGGGAPSVAQTLWMNLGVIDPVMAKLAPSDIIATTYNDTMSIYVQMAIEDEQNLGNPDLSALDYLDQDKDGQQDDTIDTSKLSEWVPITSIVSLNGFHYQYLRVRIVFQLDSGQKPSHPLPYLDVLRFPYGF